jgi:hypothetical protein
MRKVVNKIKASLRVSFGFGEVCCLENEVADINP